MLPKHRPYRSAGAEFQIGLTPMDNAEWLDIGPDHREFMKAKRERLRGNPALFYRTMPRSLEAQRELLAMVVDSLLTHHTEAFGRKDDILEDKIDGSHHDLRSVTAEPLELVGNIIEEDFVLFEREGADDIVVAASNAYTSSGRIVSCVGRDLQFAHDPVPGLNASLAPRIDRVIANVKAGAPVVRFNWFVTAISNRLFPEGLDHAGWQAAQSVGQFLAQDHDRIGDLLWLRVERQTFKRLPNTGALAFGIYTYSDPLAGIATDTESLNGLDRLVRTYSEERLRYSGIVHFKEPLLRWIGERLASL